MLNRDQRYLSLVTKLAIGKHGLSRMHVLNVMRVLNVLSVLKLMYLLSCLSLLCVLCLLCPKDKALKL